MNFKLIFALLIASRGHVSGFTPSKPVSFSLTSQQLPYVTFIPKSRCRNTLFSEVEEAADPSPVEAADPSPIEATESSDEQQEPEFDRSIYIGNVSFDTTESDLRAVFSPYGTVKKITVPLDKVTNRSRGFAFVLMSNAEEMTSAIEALNESEVGGRTIYVSESLPKDKLGDNKRKYTNKKFGTKIYVGNLDFGTTAEDLESAFAAYGEVKDCFIPTDNNGNHRGFAFVSMDEEDALTAIEELNGTEIDGRTISVNKSLPKGSKAKSRQIKLYVGNLSWGTEEGSLRELFEEYGSVIDCYVPLDRETGQHRGFAFITMDANDALRAADETDGYELDGRILRVNEAQPKGYTRSYSDNEGYDGGDAYDENGDESWGNEGY